MFSILWDELGFVLDFFPYILNESLATILWTSIGLILNYFSFAIFMRHFCERQAISKWYAFIPFYRVWLLLKFSLPRKYHESKYFGLMLCTYAITFLLFRVPFGLPVDSIFNFCIFTYIYIRSINEYKRAGFDKYLAASYCLYVCMGKLSFLILEKSVRDSDVLYFT